MRCEQGLEQSAERSADSVAEGYWVMSALPTALGTASVETSRKADEGEGSGKIPVVHEHGDGP